jgi:hypothetical protein
MRNSSKKFSKKKSDIAVTLDAYHCHLKKVEDKEHFKIRQEFSRSLAKLSSLDTRDIVRPIKWIKKAPCEVRCWSNLDLGNEGNLELDSEEQDSQDG